MRRLMILRHAESDRPDGIGDFDRPLTPSGQAAASRMADYLLEERLLPDLALVSSARRTQETWNPLKAKLGTVEVRFKPRLYEAPAQRILDLVRETEPGVHSLLVIGHNPGLEEFARLLVGYGDRYALARLMREFPTTGLAIIDFAAEAWLEVEPAQGRLDRFVTPPMLNVEDD